MLPDIDIPRSAILVKKHIAQEEIKILKAAVGKTLKTKKKLSRNQFGNIILNADKSDILNEDREAWASKHGAKLTSKLTTKEVRNLRAWFNALDVDKSGGIGMDELLDPLLSAGLLKCKSDVRALIDTADTDHSGEIGFDEFLNAIQKNQLCDRSSIGRLQSITNPVDGGLSSQTRLSEERRRRMLSTVVDDTARRQADMDAVYSAQEAYHMASMSQGDVAAGDAVLSPKPHQPKLGQVLCNHQHQKKVALAYLQSLETVVETHRASIAKDNIVSTTARRPVGKGDSGGRRFGGGMAPGDICSDDVRDRGYRGELAGLSQPLQKVSVIDKHQSGKGTYAILPRTTSSGDYAQYDTRATIYSDMAVQVEAHTKAQIYNYDSPPPPRRQGKLQKLDTRLLKSTSEEGLASPSVCLPSESGLVRMNSKPLRRIDTMQLKRLPSTENSSKSVLKLKRLKSVEDFVPRSKISIVRHFQKNIIIDVADDDSTM